MSLINSNTEKDVSKDILFYLFINAILVNVVWWFLFMLGSHMTSKKEDFFNNVIAPNLTNAYSITLSLGILLLIIGLVMIKLDISLGKKISVLAIWLSIASPLFVAVYYLLLFLYGKADIPNLIVIPFSLGIGYFNFARGMPIIRKTV